MQQFSNTTSLQRNTILMKIVPPKFKRVHIVVLKELRVASLFSRSCICIPSKYVICSCHYCNKPVRAKWGDRSRIWKCTRKIDGYEIVDEFEIFRVWVVFFLVQSFSFIVNTRFSLNCFSRPQYTVCTEVVLPFYYFFIVRTNRNTTTNKSIQGKKKQSSFA